MKKIILLFAMMLAVGTVSASIVNVKYASFGTPGSNATYTESTGYYEWTQSNNNLMQMFSFSNGELANYTQLKLTFSSNSGNIRVNFVYGTGGSDNLSFNGNDGDYFGSAGTKTITMSSLSTKLSTVSKTLADVTAIRIGGHGSSSTGHCTLKWSDVYLENDDDAVLTACFGTIGGNATYNCPTYACKDAGSNNLMNTFSGSAGDFSKYSNGVLQFTISDLAKGNMVRVGYHNGSSLSEFGSGFGSSGTKVVDISGQSSNAAAATTIKFGARSGTANETSFVTIRPDQMFLVRSEAYTRSFTANQKSTVWLPFALTAEEVAAIDGKFYELTAASGSSLTFTEVTGATEAYKPYVFVANSTGTPFSGMKTKTIVAPKTCSYTVGDFTFVGSMKDTTVPNGAYGYNSTNGNFSKTTSDAVTIAPFRAYITVSGTAPARVLTAVFNDESTGIATVKQAQTETGVMYNLAGQRVSENHKGIVIMNGRKYVVK